MANTEMASTMSTERKELHIPQPISLVKYVPKSINSSSSSISEFKSKLAASEWKTRDGSVTLKLAKGFETEFIAFSSMGVSETTTGKFVIIKFSDSALNNDDLALKTALDKMDSVGHIVWEKFGSEAEHKLFGTRYDELHAKASAVLMAGTAKCLFLDDQKEDFVATFFLPKRAAWVSCTHHTGGEAIPVKSVKKWKGTTGNSFFQVKIQISSFSFKWDEESARLIISPFINIRSLGWIDNGQPTSVDSDDDEKAEAHEEARKRDCSMVENFKESSVFKERYKKNSKRKNSSKKKRKVIDVSKDEEETN